MPLIRIQDPLFGDSNMQNDPNLQMDPAALQMDPAQVQEVAAIFGTVFFVVFLPLLIITLIGMWKMFSKAGIPGIYAIIPIVNIFFLPKVGGKPIWWAILFFVPLVQIVFIILTYMAIAERFGRGVGTVLGLIFLKPIFFCILGFGSAQWTPPPSNA
jgi:hypothetical protein